MPTLDIISRDVGMATLADYTQPGLILPELREQDPAGIISELSQALQRSGCVPDVLPFYHAALNHEMLASSALDCGLAFPHARLKGIKHLQFAVGRADQLVIWGSKGALPVQFVFLLAVPATDAAPYLHLLAGLARLGKEPQNLSHLRNAADANAIFAALQRVKMSQE